MKKFLLFIASASLLLQSLLPYSATLSFAQEVTPTPTQTEESAQTAEPSDIQTSTATDPMATEVPAENPIETSVEAPTPEPSPTVEPTPTQSEPQPTPVISETLISSPSAETPDLTPAPTAMPSATPLWNDLGGGAFETNQAVLVGEEYIYANNNKLRVKFTQLPGPAGKLSIKEIKLTPDQILQTGALSDTAYEITSTMADGTFTYDLTLPLPPEAQGKEVEVVAAESESELPSAPELNEQKEKTADTITIRGLNHFTVFVITTPNPDTTQRVLINEVAPTVVAEWIELFNNGTQPVNLAAGTGWVIRNSAGNSQSLSALGTIAPAGRAVFNAPAGWLLDVAPETVSILNELGSTIDTVTISLTAPGFALDHYPLAGESVGRKTDGIAEWAIFTSPTKGTANVLPPAGAGGLSEVGPIAPAGGFIAGFPIWYKDSNGLALDLMEAADGFGISDPTDPAVPFSEQIG
ncbi:MAG: hypothetical protein UV33_C0016G0001, partial [Candidatus Daviesbacteria bacterium GW2011_GWA1_42_6]